MQLKAIEVFLKMVVLHPLTFDVFGSMHFWREVDIGVKRDPAKGTHALLGKFH